MVAIGILDEGPQPGSPISWLRKQVRGPDSRRGRHGRGLLIRFGENDSIGKGLLMRPRLRLFVGDDGLAGTDVADAEISIELEELTRILADAIIWDRAWLSDLADERVKVSADLYEVLMAYSHMRPTAS